ncbi:MAG TPA: ATP-binding protein [Flavitalea sp.]|nr:ATP-binding protein [Flavitalea sp.]
MDPKEEDFFTAIEIVAGILAIIISYFLITIIRHQRRNLHLHKAKILAEITTLENERRRIASDLHDELGPLLSAVKLQITNLETEIPHDVKLIEKSSGHIDDIIQKLREISNNLMPNTLLRKGLKVAIEDSISRVKDVYPLNITLEFPEDVVLSQDKEINLYRVIQEIIHNTIKHAQAKNLRLIFSREKDLIVLRTDDDGIGFNYEQKTKMAGGLGLLNLQSRTEVMGGEFTYASEKGSGTRYLFEIPA